MEDLAQQRKWKKGKNSELLFWQEWFKTQGLQWPQDYRARLNPKTPLQDFIIELLDVSPDSSVSILDVGAGPLTYLGKVWGEHNLQITAVDPLADQYNDFMTIMGISPLVTTQPCEVEQLTAKFPSDSFDVVFMRNALDHSYNPLSGIRQMLTLVKPNAYILLIHNLNEGKAENYSGFHQWNFCEKFGDFIVWNTEQKINVTKEIQGEAVTSVKVCKGSIEVRIKKNNTF